MPARVLLQDFTGVPAIVDLATIALKAVQRMGGNPKRINPLFPAELVIDHSVQVDNFWKRQRVRPEMRSWSFSVTSSATRSCAGGRRRFQNFKSGSAGHGHLPPSEPGIPRRGVVCAMPYGNRF